jgi:hypothetical protein
MAEKEGTTMFGTRWLDWLACGVGLWLIYFGALGWYVATVKRRDPLEGILLAILSGPVGLILVALFPEGKPTIEIERTPDSLEPPPVVARPRLRLGEDEDL